MRQAGWRSSREPAVENGACAGVEGTGLEEGGDEIWVEGEEVVARRV